MSKRQILQIIKFLKKQGLFTHSKTHDIVIKRFENSSKSVDDVIKFILTSGEVSGKMECSRCKKMLPGHMFSYYQTRVSSDGFLMRSNALCKDCGKKINQERKEVLDKAIIPPKPEPDSVCPNCGRKWAGNWHRHHDETTKQFIDWLCSNCNMAMQDQRNPRTKYGR